MITERELERIVRDAFKKHHTVSAVKRAVAAKLNGPRRAEIESETERLEAEAHRFMEIHKPMPNESHCFCGFCVYSVEHVMLMFARHLAEKS